jgi:glycosyltransferase involved in cell wall biosynthesis
MQKEPSPPELSIVIPVYNEEDNVLPLYAKVREVMEGQKRSWELILVDDGSSDRTPVGLADLADSDPRVVVVELRRNFGQTAAIAAGFHQARGTIVVTLDADLQNDPVDIPRMLEIYEKGYDVVSGWRRRRQDGFLLRTFPSRIANALISWGTGVHLHDYGCTLKIYNRALLRDLNLYGEMHRFLPALMHHQGARVTEVEVNHHPRLRGKSKYGIGRAAKVVLDLLTVIFMGSYSTKPIYVFGWIGMFFMSMSLGAFAWMLYLKFATGLSMILTPLPVLTAVLFMMGVQILMMGLLAELQVRTYYESQRRPIYNVRRIRGGGALLKGTTG